MGTPQLVAALASLGAFALLYGFLARTESGVALQATAQDRHAAALMGIDAERRPTLLRCHRDHRHRRDRQTIAINWGLIGGARRVWLPTSGCILESGRVLLEGPAAPLLASEEGGRVFLGL